MLCCYGGCSVPEPSEAVRRARWFLKYCTERENEKTSAAYFTRYMTCTCDMCMHMSMLHMCMCTHMHVHVHVHVHVACAYQDRDLCACMCACVQGLNDLYVYIPGPGRPALAAVGRLH